MSPPLTVEQATALLRAHPDSYDTSEKLRALAAQVNADSPGRVTVLYSGRSTEGIGSGDIIKAMKVAGEDVRVIDNSQAAKFMTSDDFYHAVAKTYGISDFRSLADGSYRGPATDWLYHPTQGPWADASARFADSTVGEVRALVSDARPDRVFGATEVPHILANPNVTTIEGIPRKTLVARQATHGTQAAFEMVSAHAYDGVGRLNVAVNYAGTPLRENGTLMLDSRAYLAETKLPGKTPGFTVMTRPLADNMPPPGDHVLAGRQHMDEFVIQMGHEARVHTTRIRAGSTLGIAGLALDAYDAADTLRTSGRLRSEGNDTAAESELIHFGARSVGGFAGAGLGMTAGAVAGVETGPGLVVTGALGGIAGAVAGDEIAAWTDNRRIYNQQDRQGHTWTYDPDQPAQGWQRHAPIDASNDGIDNPKRGPLRASPALANELNYRSTSTSVELMLGGPPSQRDPFVQPAKASDPPSAFPAAWTRDADQQAWQREVMVAFTERGMSRKRVDVASPERADELDRAAAQTVLQNAANSPAAIAARYEEAYARNGWAAHGPMPDAVRHARSDLDTLFASDANRYQRRANGEWVSEGLIYNATAAGNLREELDATREVLRARLPSPRTVQAPPPPTPDDRLRDTVMGAYANAGVVPDAARLAASVAAVRATQTMHGLDPDTTALQLQRGAQGRLDVDSPIASLRLDADGKTYVVAAVTTTEDIQRAQGPTPAADARPAPSATMAQSDRLVERYLRALAAGDDEGVRAASIAFLDSDDGQRLVAGSQERTLQHQQHLPGRDRPLFVQAMQHLERLGPEAVGYADQADMERIAGVVACEATQRRMPSIDDIQVRDDGHLRVSCHNERNPVLSQHTQIDGLLASFQPLEQSFQKLEVETQRQAQQDMQRAHERQASAQHGMWM